MWSRISQTDGKSVHRNGSEAPGGDPAARRAYYRVEGVLPIRLTPLAPEDVEAAVFDLSMPDPLCAPIGEAEGEEESPMAARLRRIEEKLDLLLGASPVEVPRQLTGADRRPMVFSGSGLALDVADAYCAGDAFGVEILLPPPYARTLRAVAHATRVVDPGGRTDGLRKLPLALTHMDDEDRDALVAYSYDLQRFALRARTDERAEQTGNASPGSPQAVSSAPALQAGPGGGLAG